MMNDSLKSGVVLAFIAILVLVLAVFLPWGESWANNRLQEGLYESGTAYLDQEQYEEAASAFQQLGDYRDSASLKQTAEKGLAYQRAEALRNEGLFFEASDAFLAISEFKDSSSMAEQCIQDAYDQAVGLLWQCKFEESESLFSQLGDYRDAAEKRQYCQYRIDCAREPMERKLTGDGWLCASFPGGNLYCNDKAYFFVPLECNSETKFIVYYAGGAGEDILSINLQYVWAYYGEYCPNAVIIMFRESGLLHMQKINELAMDYIRQLELECGIVARDLTVIGSSNGGFTALRAGVQLHTTGGYHIKNVLTMDTGNEWIEITGRDNLTDEECEILAEQGTKLYLFEQDGVGMNKEPIANLVNHGADVTVVECKNDDHNRISVNMYRENVFGWAIGEYANLNAEEYKLIPLSPEG